MYPNPFLINPWAAAQAAQIRALQIQQLQQQNRVNPQTTNNTIQPTLITTQLQQQRHLNQLIRPPQPIASILQHPHQARPQHHQLNNHNNHSTNIHNNHKSSHHHHSNHHKRRNYRDHHNHNNNNHNNHRGSKYHNNNNNNRHRTDNKNKNKSNNSLYPQTCTLCKQTCNSAQQWEMHIKGKKHARIAKYNNRQNNIGTNTSSDISS